MTKSHFIEIARIFRSQMDNPTVPTEARIALIANANMQADLFEAINPHFDRDLFLTACGMQAKV